jgi:hypothetical protein
MAIRKQAANSSAAGVGRPNSVGLGERELARLLDEVDRETNDSAVKRRKFVRWPYRRTVKVTLRQGGGSPVDLNMACRNLSSGGAGLLHSSYIYDNSEVEIMLPATNGSIVATKGRVVHCRHVQGTTHEIGVQFDSTINPRDFLSLDAFSDGFTLEHVDPEQLDGCVLAVDDSEMDLRILQHYLEGCELILCDYLIGEERGAEFVSRLRESGSRTPVIMVTADQTSTTREQLLESKADAFLAKPVGREVLLRAIAEFMLMGSLGDAVKSSLPEGHPNLALLPDFTKDLAEIASGLEKSLESDDFKTCRRLCLRISGTGPSLGFEPLAQCAERVANAVAASKSTVSASAEITSLVGLLRKVAA